MPNSAPLEGDIDSFVNLYKVSVLYLNFTGQYTSVLIIQKMRTEYNVDLIWGQGRSRWANIWSALVQLLMFAEMPHFSPACIGNIRLYVIMKILRLKNSYRPDILFFKCGRVVSYITVLTSDFKTLSANEHVIASKQ